MFPKQSTSEQISSLCFYFMLSAKIHKIIDNPKLIFDFLPNASLLQQKGDDFSLPKRFVFT